MKIKNIKSLLNNKYNIDNFNNYSNEEKTAFIINKIKDILGYELYNEQIEASIALYENYAVDMKTGEGKSLASIIPLILKTYENDLPSYFLSINEYLIKRDMEEFKPLFDFFDIEISLYFNNYKKNKCIIYITPDILINQYLRYYSFYNQIKINLNSYFLIDEADFVFIDNALRPIVLTTKSKINKKDIKYITELRNKLDIKDFKIEDNTYVTFYDTGIKKLEKLLKTNNIFDFNNFEIVKNIEILILTELKFQKDIDYIVENNKLFLIDEKTGDKRDFHTIDYTKQFIEYKEGLKLSEIKLPFQKITFQHFFKNIKNKSAMSGTVLYERQYFDFYNMKIKKIKRRLKLKLIKLDNKFFLSKKDKLKSLINEVSETITKTNRSVLIGTTNIKDSESIYNILTKLYPKIKINLLTAKNIEEENKIIKEAGIANTITIITQIAGRGVDIKIDKEVIEAGGMLLLMFEQNLNFRMDEQIIGRVGRQGKPGSFRFYHSMEDFLIVNYCSQGIKNLLSNLIDETGGTPKFRLITKHLNEIQKKHETNEFLMFSHISQYDEILNKQRTIIFNYIEDTLNTNGYKSLEKIINNIANEKDLKELIEYYNNIFFEINENENLTIDKINEAVIKTLTKNINDNLLKDLIFKTLLINWQKFLIDSEILLEGIVWRSKSNKDPLIEYDREMYYLFIELINTIRKNIIKSLIKYQIQLYIETKK